MKKFADLPRLGSQGPPVPLRIFGLVATAAIILSVFETEPRPDFSGDGLWVTVALVLFMVGFPLSIRRRELPPGHRFAGALMIGIASVVFCAAQPSSAGYATLYYVAVIAGMRLPRWPAVIALGGPLVAAAVALALTDDHPGIGPVGLVSSVLPWFLVMRLIRSLNARRQVAEDLVEELRESRAATATAAAEAERGRLARDMHDVLAHSLSALALQLEGTRLLARDRGSDPEVVDGLERAHHLAATGLAEARQAIAALRGDALPGPERLKELVDAFPGATLTTIGEPREHSSEARLALYRTAQEALTNVRRHSAADRVDVRLLYADDGTTLTVRDHGPGAPVLVGTPGGYGLTGMRERAELLGGRLTAEPTSDGFLVELWLPR